MCSIYEGKRLAPQVGLEPTTPSVNRRAAPPGVPCFSMTYTEPNDAFGAHSAHNGLRNGLQLSTIHRAAEDGFTSAIVPSPARPYAL